MKRLVLCLDGTWNDDRDGDTPTNIVRLRQLVEDANRRAPAGSIEQRVYYDAGVGTRGLVDRVLGGTLGVGLSENVREAYRFLSQFYEGNANNKDEIYVFGFSRGAFTARSLAGFVAASGLLRKENCDAENLEFAWRYYRTPPRQRLPADKARLELLSTPNVRIHFLGVFDTVGSLGIPLGVAGNWAGSFDQFHDTKLGSAIDYAFHALAIDEHRGPFVPAIWAKPDHNRNLAVRQVWFPGVHSDIGGGFSRQEDLQRQRTPVCDLSLAWMVSQLKHTKLDISPVAMPTAVAPGEAHEHFGFFLYSRAVPMYRLIAATPLKPAPRSPHHTYQVAPPDHSHFEALHVSALDLMAATARDNRRADYQPRNLISARRLIGTPDLPLIDYDGTEISDHRRIQELIDAAFPS